MPNKWNTRDLLKLTCDCELGPHDALLHVVKADGPYMTIRRHADGVLLHTGRDYAFATKIGEGAIDKSDDGPFSRIGDILDDCTGKLREAERQMRKVPTAHHSAIQVVEVCDKLDKIAEEFAAADHAGTS